MMIKCQKCGFENQMGSIFCRECGEKLNMDAIDPNKLQKDVEKEKNIKLAKKRIKGAISASISILVVVAFVYLVFPGVFPFPSGLREFEESAVTEAIANQKFNAAANGTGSGEVQYSYADINKMLQVKVVDPLAAEDSFAKITGIEVAYDEEKNQPVAYVWISIKEKVPVLYAIHGDFVFKGEEGDPSMPITLDVKRLDIGRLPVFVSTHTFLNGFNSVLQNDAMQNFFQRAREVRFTADGMTVNFNKGNPANSMAPQASSSSNKSSASTGVAALKGGSTAASEKAEAARQKAEEEKQRKKELEEERKRKAEEYKQQQKEKEEERKRKIEEEKERKREAEEERKRKIEEENERRRQEAEDRRREREERRNNNNYNSRSSRSNRSSSRNRY